MKIYHKLTFAFLVIAFLLGGYRKYTKYPNQEIPYLKQKAKENLENTAHHIRLGKEATQIALQMALSVSDETRILEIKEELKFLNSIETEFLRYKSLFADYLELIEINPDYSYIFLEIYLEPQFRAKIMPLAQNYRKYALKETKKAFKSTI